MAWGSALVTVTMGLLRKYHTNLRGPLIELGRAAVWPGS
jgi:hypothetical protein